MPRAWVACSSSRSAQVARMTRVEKGGVPISFMTLQGFASQARDSQRDYVALRPRGNDPARPLRPIPLTRAFNSSGCGETGARGKQRLSREPRARAIATLGASAPSRPGRRGDRASWENPPRQRKCAPCELQATKLSCAGLAPDMKSPRLAPSRSPAEAENRDAWARRRNRMCDRSRQSVRPA